MLTNLPLLKNPNEILLDTEERRWLEMKAKENQTTIAALIGKAVKQMHQEKDKAKHPIDFS